MKNYSWTVTLGSFLSLELSRYIFCCIHANHASLSGHSKGCGKIPLENNERRSKVARAVKVKEKAVVFDVWRIFAGSEGNILHIHTRFKTIIEGYSKYEAKTSPIAEVTFHSVL